MKFEIYPDKAGKWRWRLKARNGQIVADGSQGDSRKDAVIRAIRSIESNLTGELCDECGKRWAVTIYTSSPARGNQAYGNLPPVHRSPAWYRACHATRSHRQG